MASFERMVTGGWRLARAAGIFALVGGAEACAPPAQVGGVRATPVGAGASFSVRAADRA